MEDNNMPNIRIDNIEINNFKNVKHGVIDLTSKKQTASVLALYGQNGSGKTALIESIDILKNAISGRKLPEYASALVNLDSDHSTFTFKFSITDNLDVTYLIYKFSIKRETVETIELTDKIAYTAIFDEVVSISKYSNGKSVSPLKPLIDTTDGEPFGPQTKYRALIGKDLDTDVIVAKKLAYKSGTSFIFSNELLSLIKNNADEDIVKPLFAINAYGIRNLFVLSIRDSALISFDALPLAFKIEDENQGASGKISIPINGNGIIPEVFYDLLIKIIKSMNVVLEQIIPGLNIGVKSLGEELLKDNTKGIRVQLTSIRVNKSIALKYESEGIKKIVAILQLLIVIYNNPSVTVAIDELDSGIFEYLLGEIMRIISEHGKGQLIFTSHNLRPLETIDKSFVAFTTVNPDNRYIRFTNVKTSNNLRDFYYRDIILGEQSEPVYEPTNNRKIAYAFLKAGDVDGA
jgi:AAA15 family ATPase/GTPase